MKERRERVATDTGGTLIEV